MPWLHPFLSGLNVAQLGLLHDVPTMTDSMFTYFLQTRWNRKI